MKRAFYIPEKKMKKKKKRRKTRKVGVYNYTHTHKRAGDTNRTPQKNGPINTLCGEKLQKEQKNCIQSRVYKSSHINKRLQYCLINTTLEA